MNGRLYTLQELIKKYNTKLIIHPNGSIEHSDYEVLIEPEMFEHLGQSVSPDNNSYYDWILEPWMYTTKHVTPGYSNKGLSIHATNRGFNNVDIVIRRNSDMAVIQEMSLDIQMTRSFAKNLMEICDEA